MQNNCNRMDENGIAVACSVAIGPVPFVVIAPCRRMDVCTLGFLIIPIVVVSFVEAVVSVCVCRCDAVV